MGGNFVKNIGEKRWVKKYGWELCKKYWWKPRKKYG